MTRNALILGASGRFGRNAAQQFAKAGWTVRRFDRARGDLNKAAEGMDVIINGWNPAYPDWQSQVPELHARVIDAARRSGATVIIPGNVYVFGPEVPAPWSERSLHLARNPLGRIRVEMEAAYRRAGVQCINVRGGDFIDTEASGNWFDMVMIKSLRKGLFISPGKPDIRRAWAYLPDLCRAAVDLAEMRAELPMYSDVPFPGYTLSANDIAAELGAVTGSDVRVRQMSWLPLYLARPFWRLGACILEMRYIWDLPHELDAARFNELLPGFRGTPVRDALARAVPGNLLHQHIHPDEPVAAGQ